MGNIGSHTGQINNSRSSLEDQWTQSFPRTQPTRFQHKVLPERDTRQRLRHTDNGEILQQGGTLSGRHQPQLRNSVGNLSSRNEDNFSEGPINRSYLPTQRYSFHKTGFGSSQYIHHKQNAANQKALKEQMKLFGSEPDLRLSMQLVSPDQEMKERRNRKKYKAPPPPTNKTPEKQLTDWEENSSDDFPIRKARLFKTRAEMKKQASHVNKFENNLDPKYEEKTTTVQINSHQQNVNNRPNRLSLPEMKIAESEEFQRELKEATRKLRSSRIHSNTNGISFDIQGDKEKLKTLDPNRDLIKRKFKQIIEIEENNNTSSNSLNSPRGEPSGKESSTPEQSPFMTPKDQNHAKPKTFYFGMEESTGRPTYRSENLAGLMRVKRIAHSSESDISTDIDPDETNDAATTGIDLQLRPILPKKQLEIPRFSPAIAWKLLSAIENENGKGTLRSEDIPVMFEEKIEKYARPPPPNVQIGQRSHDKSGDSGISGDAGPVGFEEIDQNTKKTQYERKTGMSWVPEQDLEDDSSLEELNLEISAQKNRRNLLNRPHVFSLSLPRDNHLAAYITDKTDYHSSSFQKLKRSVSGVFGNLSHRRDLTQSNANLEDGANWFFSKSAPNSLNNGFNSLDTRNTQDETDLSFTTAKTPHRSSTTRLMYLPEYGRKSPEPRILESRGDEKKTKLSVFSKSCEELYAETPVPETLQDPPKSYENEWKFPTKKSKKFTFQSTVRQIERRRMAEKLSKEAEKKEKQRLRELEAMQRVEEEFQRKRAKEKASIRQQLRLYAMDDNQWASLPPNLESKPEERQEPDGAFSSSTSSSPPPPPPQIRPQKIEKIELKHIAPVTQELSEYRQVQRDYKDYRGNFKYNSDSRYPKQTTIHPKVTCNMPKAKGSNLGNGNYRKDFAYGVKSTKSLGSTHSEDSISNSPKIYHNKYTPVTRF